MTTVVRGVRLGVCCGVAIAALTACGVEDSAAPGSGTSTGPPPSTVTMVPTTPTPVSTPASPNPAAGPPRCTAATLAGTMRPEDAGAGNRYATLVVTNRASAPCTLYGYGGLQLVDAQGNPTPTNLMRTPDPGPVAVTLAPGESAGKRLRWGVVPAGDEPVTGPCEPPSAGARIIPPDETEPFAISYDFGSVCDEGRIEGSAFFKS